MVLSKSLYKVCFV